MSTAEATLTVGEVFLETADGTRINLGQLKAPFNISVVPVKAEPKPIQIGSTVRISDDPKCDCGIPANRALAGQVGKVVQGPLDGDDWQVEHASIKNWIAAEHLTVVD